MHMPTHIYKAELKDRYRDGGERERVPEADAQVFRRDAEACDRRGASMRVQKVGKRLSECKRPLDPCVLVDERVVICSERSRKGRIQVLLWNQTCARGADGEVDDARRHLRLAEPKALVLVLAGHLVAGLSTLETRTQVPRICHPSSPHAHGDVPMLQLFQPGS